MELKKFISATCSWRWNFCKSASLTDALLAHHAIFPPQKERVYDISQKRVCKGGYVETPGAGNENTEAT